MTEFFPTIGALGLDLVQLLLNELIGLLFGLDVGVLGFEFCDEGLEIDDLFLERFVGAEVVILGVDDGGGLMPLVGCEVDGSIEGAAGNTDGAGLFCHLLFCSPIDRL